MGCEKKGVLIKKLIKKFNLKPIHLPKNFEKILISTSNINRASLYILGFYECFNSNKILIFGYVEIFYLKRMSLKERSNCLSKIYEKKPVAIIFTKESEILNEIKIFAEKFEVATFKINENTSHFMAGLINYLNLKLRLTVGVHGVLVEIYDEGVLIVGESGIGKTETALQLVKNGHKLIADDVVKIFKLSSKELMGTSPEKTRGFVEVKGIGILNVKKLYGERSIKKEKKIDFVVVLKKWEEGEIYLKTGLEEKFEDILGVKLLKYDILTKPGRNIPLILEVVALNNRQKRLGFNSAKDFFYNAGFKHFN